MRFSSPVQKLVLIGTLAFAAAMARYAGAASLLLATGEPDPSSENLRLWLRADSGIQDARGRGPADPDFSGIVATWSDRSARKFDLTAASGKPPLFVQRQPSAGNRPTVAFTGEQVLARTNSALNDRPTSTVLLVVQGQPGYGNLNIYSVGKDQNTRERLGLTFSGDVDASLAGVGGVYLTNGGERAMDMPLSLPSDGRSGGRFVVILFNGEADRRTLEFHDGLGDPMGAPRTISMLAPQQAASDKCQQNFYLGTADENSRFCGQVAEMMVFNRGLSIAEGRDLVNYLRHRYELDMTDAFFPPGTFLLQAEDFEGNWLLAAAAPNEPGRYLGGRHVAADGEDANQGIKTKVDLPRDGKYYVWVRANENSWQTVPPNGSAIRTFIQGKELRSTHARGPASTTVWRQAGEVVLKAGPTEILVRGEGPGIKDCDAVLISPTAATMDAVDEICALAQRVRGVGGTARVTALYENGLRLDGSLLTGWRWVGPSGQVSRPNPSTLPAMVCLQLDRRPAESESPAAVPGECLLEFQNGDRLRGTICGYVPAGSKAGQSSSAQLLVRMPGGYIQHAIGVEIDWLRRIVFVPSLRNRPAAPKTLIRRNGRVYTFRAIRWSAESVSALTDESLEQIPLGEVAEMCLAANDPWDTYYRELSQLDPEGDAAIIRVETADGMSLTASTIRSSHLAAPGDTVAQVHLLQPAWSRSSIPIPWARTRLLWRAPAHVVPLSRFAPQQVAQRGALGSSWKWQVDRNVAGGALRSEGLDFLWGFGVHAPNEMVFALPDCVRAFRTSLGIDAAVGSSGCVIAKVLAHPSSAAPLYQSKPLVGSGMTVSTGEIALPPAAGSARKLVLVTENASVASGEGDGLDIGNHVDWLEPTLLLDPALLHAKVIKPLEK